MQFFKKTTTIWTYSCYYCFLNAPNSSNKDPKHAKSK